MRSEWMLKRAAIAALGCCLAMAACAEGTDTGRDTSLQPQTDGGAPVGALCPAPDAGSPRLNDAQILNVLIAANAGEVLVGRLAESKATDQNVKTFATDMVNEHTATLQRLNTLAQNMQLTPEQSALSEQVTAQAVQMSEILSALSGATFDLAYMDSQVSMHSTFAFFGDAVLMEQVQNSALRTELETERATVQAHLERAAPIQASLSPHPMP